MELEPPGMDGYGRLRELLATGSRAVVVFHSDVNDLSWKKIIKTGARYSRHVSKGSKAVKQKFLKND